MTNDIELHGYQDALDAKNKPDPIANEEQPQDTTEATGSPPGALKQDLDKIAFDELDQGGDEDRREQLEDLDEKNQERPIPR